MPRWVMLLGCLLVGFAAGVAFGRYVAPVEYVDTTPATLRVDFRTDYILMVAEALHSDRDAEAARRKLALLGSPAASRACAEAISFARASAYSTADVELLQELMQSMLGLEASSAPTGTTP